MKVLGQYLLYSILLCAAAFKEQNLKLRSNVFVSIYLSICLSIFIKLTYVCVRVYVRVFVVVCVYVFAWSAGVYTDVYGLPPEFHRTPECATLPRLTGPVKSPPP